ncbi:MAG: hypothetical protein KAS18_00440 [Calditrichia bacterium]|nr:hypothetical protein [Calditrichia bacterium]
MELILVLVIFGISFLLLSVGIIFSKKEIHAGSCGSELIVNGEHLSCGACPSKEAEICSSGDKDGFASVAQLGNPARKKKFNNKYFSNN